MLLERFQLARRPAGREFLFFKDEVWTFGDFCRAIEGERDRLAAAGVQGGTVVAVCGPYSPASVVAAFAAAELKAIVLPLTELNDSVREERFRVAGVEVMAGVNEEGGRKKEKSWVEERENRVKIETVRTKNREPRTRESDRVASRHPLITQLTDAGRAGLILFSSGTTGTPKAMLHDLVRLTEGYAVKAGPGPSTLAFLHYDHIGGLDILFRALASGAPLVIPESRDPAEIARSIERHGIEVLPASPTFLNLLLLSGAVERQDLSSLKIIAYGSEPMPQSLLRRLGNAFPGVRLQQKFGTSETSAVRVVGRTPESLEMRVEDDRFAWKVIEGELWLKSPSRILGYLNADNSTLGDDGWYRTGDLVEETGDGYFRIVGRMSDLINVGGEKVFPAEVENVLMEMPEIRECRAFGEPHPLTGQVVAVEVVPAEILTASELKKRIRTFCRDRLESYRIPVKVYPVKRIETGDSFKKKRALDG